MQTTANLFYGTSGPHDASVMIVGEAWGTEEANLKKPFVGHSGRELDKMLSEAGIDKSQCFFTNVVSARPPNNDFTTFLHPIVARKETYKGLSPGPFLQAGVAVLEKQIAQVKPKLIIAAGNVPLWALSDKCSISTLAGYRLPSGISKWRGSQLYTTGPDASSNIPLLPIIHPAAILRAWDLRYVTLHDLKSRASRFLNGTTTWAPPKSPEKRTFFKPTAFEVLNQLTIWYDKAVNAPFELSVDIETYLRRDISCIGLCDDTIELCIPLFFFDEDGKSANYFPVDSEQEIILFLRKLLNHPNVKVIGQNFIYDQQFLKRLYSIEPNLSFDTMLAQHLLYPGTPKSLDYLASLYCEHYTYWKDESQDWSGKGGAEELWKYNCKDVRATYEIAQAQKALLKHEVLTEQYAFQLEQWHLTKRMMNLGVRIDEERKKNVRLEVMKLANEVEHYLLEVIPPDLRFTPVGGKWFSSPKHSQLIFYSILGLKPILHKKTKRPTLSADAFLPLQKQAPWLNPVWKRLEAIRSLEVFVSHFLDINLSFDRRLRCNFNVGGTETFRWSSSANGFGEGTNLQNLPKGDEE